MQPDLSLFVEDQARIYRESSPLFDALRKILTATLENAAKQLSGVLTVQGRLKTISNYAEKCLRRRKRFSQPAWQLTDLCGIRVIVTSKHDIEPVQRFIEESFEIDENEDTAKRLGEMEFGYQSVHYTVSLSRKSEALYRSACADIPEALFQRRGSDEAEKTGLPIGPIFKAEVQVRTLLQHAWAVMIHDNLYKTELKIKPRDLVRESGRIAALLEDADEAFLKFMKDLRGYESYYGAYMTPREIMEEITIQRAIKSQDSENPSIALKIARLADNLNDDALGPSVESDLVPFEHLGDADIHRELGMVRWKSGRKIGRGNLLRATELNPNDPDNWCELGRTYFQDKDYWEALQAYEKAFRIAPEYPRALLRYIECRILERADFEFIPLIRHNLDKAIEVSKKKISAGMNIPWAWYDIGFFELLMGRPHRSLDAYGKAILATASPAMVEAVYDSLTRIHKKAVGIYKELAEHLNWVRSLIKVVLVGRFGKPAATFLCAAEPRLDGFKALTICAGVPGLTSPFSLEKAVAIVAGDCEIGSEKIVSDYGPMIRFAFDGFKGTVCSGGTRAGVAGVVGDLTDPEGRIRKVAYIPSGHPVEDREHTSYELMRTLSGTFSPLDTIMLWSDILASGVNPEDVRVLGIGGGNLSAFEYRLALLLRAKVGILPASGGAALDIAMDTDWAMAVSSPSIPPASQGGEAASGEGKSKSCLLRLPNDRESVRAFIQPSRPSGMIDRERRERLAAEAHEHFRKDSLPSAIDGRRELAPWEDLDQTFKKSNLAQIDHIEDKLKRLGLEIKPIPNGQSPKLFHLCDHQVEILAEMEHGRWVVERLLDGWTFGETRDNERKTRPQLIPWADLPEREKNKDRNAVREIPQQLAGVGYKIYDPENS